MFETVNTSSPAVYGGRILVLPLEVDSVLAVFLVYLHLDFLDHLQLACIRTIKVVISLKTLIEVPLNIISSIDTSSDFF